MLLHVELKQGTPGAFLDAECSQDTGSLMLLDKKVDCARAALVLVVGGRQALLPARSFLLLMR